jgi:hypothetical protein
MFVLRMRRIAQLAVLPALINGFAQAPAGAASAVTLHISIKDHRFQPAELKVPANTPVTLVVRNLDPTPEEFEAGAGAVSFLWGLQRGDRRRRRRSGVGRQCSAPSSSSSGF